ncbi:glutamate--tRNA ligase family protein [Opitutales bacterium]|nr:glutamate--tRNA ligase family protein [Opitutales bacterium]
MSEEKAKQAYRGRLAPTPSGFLHQGHVRTFRTAWDRARSVGCTLVLRMDDLDSARCTEEYAQACIEDMQGMGLDWDEGPDKGGPFGPYNQSRRTELYLNALRTLHEMGCIYPCLKTRREISVAGILDSSGKEYLYPEFFRPDYIKKLPEDFPGEYNWRFRTNWGDQVGFTDIKKAEQSFLAGKDLSDFLVWRKDGNAAYELATVVDDHLMQITEVVRGEDLLVSSARQCLLLDALGWVRPTFYHCELMRDADGNKLSKSARTLPRLFSPS